MTSGGFQEGVLRGHAGHSPVALQAVMEIQSYKSSPRKDTQGPKTQLMMETGAACR